MRRILAWLMVGPLALAPLGCSEEKKPPVSAEPKRNDSVRATAAAVTASSNGSASTSKPPSMAAAPRKLCGDVHPGAGKALPTGKIDHLEATGTPALADRLPKSAGRWLWVNLWAAWCAPCREEIPLLRAWDNKLAAAGTPMNLAFVSLDDDDRQAKKYLDEQPPTGLRASWWLPEGKTRTGWLEAVKMKDTPQLPLHLLFDPQGILRCVINGAVEDGDFAQAQGIVGKR